MSFAFIHRYRATHKEGQYQPNFNHSALLESIWWGVPCVIIVIMGIMSWHYTHKLDPYRKIDGSPVSLQVQVVALPWKWLFIYPKQGIATVNYLKLPKDKQVEFFLTSDNVPMSAFFVPQLGSQIYTMAGMQTRLHLIASVNGTYRGLNAQYNGEGFSDMHFPVTVVDDKDLQSWFAEVKKSGKALDLAHYEQLRQASQANKAAFYNLSEPKLYHRILMSYMKPPKGNMSDLQG
jgi:cytochrome o ubiquinol oxidase subunit 2